MTDHFVRHMLHAGDTIETQYECRAEVGAQCRTACKKCSDQQYEACVCASLDETPDMQDYGECLVVVWLNQDMPEEQFNGDDQPVRGPDWQPIVPEWNGDTYSWDYAE